MQLDHYEYYISEHLAPAIINDDFTGLDDQEENQLRDFLESQEMRGSHWDIEDDGENYRICEVSRLLNRCAVMRLYFPKRG